MKKYNSSELPSQDGQEQIKRLYKSVNDTSRRLDESRGRASSVSELFNPAILSQRVRLCEFSEKLIFSQPLVYGRKVEELLWRKGYYDVIWTAKRLKRQDYTDEEVTHLLAHINSGIGHYHHIICRLQIEFELNLSSIIDFPILINEYLAEKTISMNKDIKEGHIQWAKDALHRCLICLGDLSRYKLEIYPNWNPGLAVRYYMQAASYNSSLGVPYNQLGTLSMNQNYSLDSAYYYIRCLCCTQPFDVAEGNLQRLFEKNSIILEQILSEKMLDPPEPISHIKKLISRFLLLCDIWFFDKKIPNMHSLCHETLLDIQGCLIYSKPISSESDESSSENGILDLADPQTPQYLNSDIVFKMVIMCLLCIMKLQDESSPQASTVVAFTLAFYSQLIQTVVQHIQDSVFNMSIPTFNEDNNNKIQLNRKNKKSRKKKSIFKLRRRKKQLSSSEESDVSENEITDTSSDEGNSDISEIDEPNSNSDSEEESDSDKDISKEHTLKMNGDTTPNLVNGHSVDESVTETDVKSNEETFVKSVEKVKKLDPNDVLELIADEGLLQSIKILGDWLRSEPEIVRACGKSGQILFARFVQLLNLLNVNTKKSHLENIKTDPTLLEKNHHKIALPEDWALRDIRLLRGGQKDIEWGSSKSTFCLPKEEALIRLFKLVGFGYHLVQMSEAGIRFNIKDKSFIVLENFLPEDHLPKEKITSQNENIPEKSKYCGPRESFNGVKNSSGQQQQLMKSMGQLWLAAEVRDLEWKVRGRNAAAPLSPYLVLDTESLIRHMYLVKQLVNARKFIIVVPSIVVSALDELKRETSRARDAIRWLESQFHRGNRFLRAQRNHESTPIPLIKYPKKKDKDSYIYIKIIECCHFLTQQQKDSINLVTLLTGNPNAIVSNENKDISYVGLAKSAGVNLELITAFHSKWKKSLKGNR